MGKRAGGGAHAAPLPDQEPLSPAPDEGIIPSFSGSLHRQEKCVCGRLSAPHHFPHQGLPLILGPLLSKATLGKDASVPPPFAPFFPDLWVDDCSWAMTPEVLDRPVGLIHCLLQSTAFSDPGRGPGLSAADGGIHCAGPSLQQLPGQALGHRGSPWLPSEPDVRGRIQ